MPDVIGIVMSPVVFIQSLRSRPAISREAINANMEGSMNTNMNHAATSNLSDSARCAITSIELDKNTIMASTIDEYLNSGSIEII